MTRVKGGTHAIKRRRNILSRAKGFRFGRGTKEIAAHDALMHAGAYAFAHRKDKKSDRRRLWQVKINAASRTEGVSFSKLIGALKKKNVLLNRKMLSELAVEHPETFKKVLAHVK
jgi:large subunit ribosomal protein L20